LDTPAHHAAAQTASDDVFRYVRCAVVASLRTPTALRKLADEEAERLLIVAERAYEQATGSLWEHEPPISYETGSTTAARGHSSATPAAVRSAAAARWLDLVLGTGMPGGPPRGLRGFPAQRRRCSHPRC
jgi:hypothetical protein